MFLRFFHCYILALFSVDIFIAFYIILDYTEFLIILGLTGFFSLLFIVLYVSKGAEKTIIIGFFPFFFLFLIFGVFYFCYKDTALSKNKNPEIYYLNREYQERSEMLALYIESKLNDEEKGFFRKNLYVTNKRLVASGGGVYFEDRLFFYEKVGGSVCLLFINSTVCKYWLDNVVEKIKKDVVNEKKEKPDNLEKVEKDRQELEIFAKDNDLSAKTLNLDKGIANGSTH